MDHHHEHGTHHHSSVVDANREYFEAHGRKIMASEDALRAAKDSAEAIKNTVQLTELDVLDFACGPGNVSKLLAPHCKSITGIDIAPGFVEDYNAAAVELKLADKMSAKCIDITKQPELVEGLKFDLVFCVAAYHHFPSPSDMTKALSGLLRPSGQLIILDGLTDENDPSKSLFGKVPSSTEDPIQAQIEHAVPHKHGFSKGEMSDLFAAAGLETVSFNQAFEFKFGERIIPTFIAVGKKN